MTEPRRSRLTRREFSGIALAAGGMFPAWLRAVGRPADQSGARQAVSGPDSLRARAAARGLLFGTAVNPALLDVDGLAGTGTSDGYTQLVGAQANILVAENAMKWAGLRPSPDIYDFSLADKLMRFAVLAGQQVRGHNLCWHEALPDWFKTTATKDNASLLLAQHIQTVAGHFRGQLQSWDVVNEAVEPRDGRGDGLRKTPWLELLGPEYLELAFQTAAESDPTAKLVYNDYGIELDTAEQIEKRGQVLLLLRRMKARGIPIHAVGVQSHLKADGPQPGAGLKGFIRDVAQMGLEIYVTEMDVNTHSLDGGPDAQDAPVARVYKDYLGMVLAEPNVPMALTWGITSAHSWLNQSKQPWALRPDGARQRPLPFDDDLKPTPAFFALRAAIDAAHPAAAVPEAKHAPAANPGDPYKPFPVQGSPTGQPLLTGPGSGNR